MDKTSAESTVLILMLSTIVLERAITLRVDNGSFWALRQCGEALKFVNFKISPLNGHYQ